MNRETPANADVAPAMETTAPADGATPSNAVAPACAHDWQPIQGWYARYRCARCRVIGYKPGAVHPQHARCTAIAPYRCQATCRGERCPEPAVSTAGGKKYRCAAHCRPARTADARKTMAQARDAGCAAGDGPDAASSATAEERT